MLLKSHEQDKKTAMPLPSGAGLFFFHPIFAPHRKGCSKNTGS
jgi:hypothetical protein